MNIYPPKKLSQFYQRVKNEIKLYTNISCIHDKVEQDGNLQLLTNTFQ